LGGLTTLVGNRSIAHVESGHSTDGSQLVAAGRLLERQEQLAAQARTGFSKAWSKLDKKKTWRWMKV
jgi:hypothetical protein